MKTIHPELRMIIQNSPELLLPVSGSYVPDVHPLVPVVDWTRVYQRGLGNLPTPEMFPILGSVQSEKER